MNLWHDVSLGKNIPEIVNAIIEIPENSKVKYELDKDTGLIKVDRILYSSVHYPLNYGFCPQTYCDDKDPLDILVATQFPLVPGCLVEARPIGVIEMIDNDEKDDKIIAVCNDDPMMNHVKALDDLAPHKLREIKHFFETYKLLQKGEIVVEEIYGREKALEIINASIALYNTNKSNLIK